MASRRLSMENRGYPNDRIREHVNAIMILLVGLVLANWALYLNGVEYLNVSPKAGTLATGQQNDQSVARHDVETTALATGPNRATTATQGTSTNSKAQSTKIESAKKAQEAKRPQSTSKALQKKRPRTGKRSYYRQCCRWTRRTFPRMCRFLEGLCHTYRYYVGRWRIIDAALLEKMDEEDAVTGTQPGDLVFYKWVDEERKDSGMYCVVVR